MPDLIILPELEQRSDTLTLTPEIAAKIIASLKAGSSRRGAAHRAFVPQSTLNGWIEEANTTQREPYRSLLAHILEAEAAYEAARIEGGQKKAKSTDDELHLLAQHPAHRDLWGKAEVDERAIVVQVGFVLNASEANRSGLVGDTPFTQLVAKRPSKRTLSKGKRSKSLPTNN